MRSKIIKSICFSIVLIVEIGIIVLFEIKRWSIGNSISGLFAGVTLPVVLKSFVDLSDNTDWKTSERKLLRGKIINKSTMVRISFAYLYRIKISNKYFLVKNGRGTGKFQPVGGVYKFNEDELLFLKNNFHVVDDDRIPIDNSSKMDYRLQLPDRYLRAFVRRFNSSKCQRERIENLSRELVEEVIRPACFKWSEVRYRYCGRHMTSLRFEEHFRCYELLLADIVELDLTDSQKRDLEELAEKEKDKYIFATADDIKSLGVIGGTNTLMESIGDHTVNILQESEQNLMKVKRIDNIFSVKLV